MTVCSKFALRLATSVTNAVWQKQSSHSTTGVR
jgi:hypothetical protein